MNHQPSIEKPHLSDEGISDEGNTTGPEPKARPGLRQPVLACVVLATAAGLAFRPAAAGSESFWVLLSAPIGALAVYSVFVLARAGCLRNLLTPRPGDLTLGAFLGGVLLILSWALRSAWLGPGTQGQGWLYSIYLQLGDPRAIQDSIPMTLLLFLVVFSEELVFRGWMQQRLEERYGLRNGWLLASGLYTAIFLPTLWTLETAGSWFNPLLVVAAAGVGLTASLCRMLSRRLVPGFFAHAVFTYFTVAQFRLPGPGNGL